MSTLRLDRKMLLALLSTVLISTTLPLFASEKDIAALIASDKQIQRFDRDLNDNYAQLMQILSASEKKQLKVEQKNWLKKRNALSSSIVDFKQAYEEREKSLRELLNDKINKIEAILLCTDEKVNHEALLNKISDCTLDFCNTYRAYFLYHANAPLAKEALANVLDIEVNDPLLTGNTENIDIITRLFLKSPEQSPSELPLWLILENPQLLDHLNERFSPEIVAPYHVRELSAFNKLQAQLDSMEEGRWVTTSYMTHAGTISIDLHAANHGYLNYLSYYPQRIIEDPERLGSTDKSLFTLLAWSYQGIWNRNSYQQFATLFDAAAKELKAYYQTHDRLKAFAPYAEALLASYVHYCFPMRYPIAETQAFQVFHQPGMSIQTLKEQTTAFTSEDWDQALSIAILNHYSSDVIEWLIQSGANVNAVFLNETPLMRAIQQPAILALLLKHGAKVDQETPFGKTALFYAVQFNQLDSVKLLLAAKANVNHRLKNIDTFKRLDSEHDYLLEKVDSFTPYIYSLRYASPNVTEYLLAMGADTKTLPPEQYQEWVSA